MFCAAVPGEVRGPVLFQVIRSPIQGKLPNDLNFTLGSCQERNWRDRLHDKFRLPGVISCGGQRLEVNSFTLGR